MPTWNDIMGEIHLAQRTNPGINPCELVLKKYLLLLSQKRQRAVILYASRWTQPGLSIPPDMLSVNDEDLQGLMTVMNGLQEPALDLILHSPGGSIESAEAFVTYLRSKFADICVVVPQQAMSAATMIACSGNKIALGKHSFLGPTDPQFIFNTELGPRVVTAQNIEEQFERARQECADPSKIGVWIPILKQYGPDLLQKCKNASHLSTSLVAGWLEQYMFHGQSDGPKKAKKIAEWISSHSEFKTHGRHLSRELLRSKGLDILDLESDPDFQDLVLSVFHATTITFDMTPVVKIMQNHTGRAYAKMMMMLPPQMAMQQMRGPLPGQMPIPGPTPIPAQPPSQPGQSGPRQVRPVVPGAAPATPAPTSNPPSQPGSSVPQNPLVNPQTDSTPSSN